MNEFPVGRNKAVFLDRDGVINRERGTYTFLLKDFEILTGVPEGLRYLKSVGYTLILITNQSGISQGLYTREQMNACHAYMHEKTDYVLDGVYYSPYHPKISESLSRKPGHLMFERAITRFNIDPHNSWMIGDKARDLVPAQALGIKGIMVGDSEVSVPLAYRAKDLRAAADFIVGWS